MNTNNQNITFVLYGLPKDETRVYMESIITETKDKAHLENARLWAIKNGFHSLRVYNHVENSKPDFISSINLKAVNNDNIKTITKLLNI